MSRLVNLYGRTKLRTKLIFSYVLLYILWILLFAFGSYHQFIGILDAQISSSTNQILHQTQQNIEYRLYEMENVSNLILMNTTLQELISRGDSLESTPITQYDDYGLLKSFLGSLTSSYNTCNYEIYVSGKLLYSYENVTFFPEDRIKDKTWYDEVLDGESKICWIGSTNNAAGAKSISAIRVLKDLKWEYGKKIGVLKVNINESDIAEILSGISTSRNAQAYLMSEEGVIISSQDKGEIGSKVQENISSEIAEMPEQGTFRIGKGADEKIVVYRNIWKLGWKLVAVVPYREMISDIRRVRDFNLFFIFTITIISMVIIYVFSAEFVKRVINITKQMKKIEETQFNQLITPKYKDELGLIEEKFNEMTVRIKRLLNDVYTSESKKRDAELKALQAQINPHFLYNTLDTINWMAVDQRAYNVSSMVSILGRYLRIILSEGRDIISIASEIEQTKLYIQIQQVRFHNMLEVEYDIDEEVEQYITVKLILQPILENSIIHGFQSKTQYKGKINIHGEKAGDIIRFEITDNGVGFDTSASINKNTDNNSDKSVHSGTGYGLKNVHERLELHFKKAVKLNIQSEIGKGTMVTIEWPAIKYET